LISGQAQAAIKSQLPDMLFAISLLMKFDLS